MTQDAWQKITTQIAHLMLTKIATLRSQSRTIQDVLPTFQKSYELAVQQHLVEPIDQDYLDLITDIFNIEEQINDMSTVFKCLQKSSNPSDWITALSKEFNMS